MQQPLRHKKSASLSQVFLPLRLLRPNGSFGGSSSGSRTPSSTEQHREFGSSLAATLPREILLLIFWYLRPRTPGFGEMEESVEEALSNRLQRSRLFRSVALVGSTNLRERTLGSALLVCRHWLPWGREVLYSVVHLRSLRACELLARTLKERPELGSLIKALYMVRLSVTTPSRLTVGREFEEKPEVVHTALHRVERVLQTILDNCEPETLSVSAWVHQPGSSSPIASKKTKKGVPRIPAPLAHFGRVRVLHLQSALKLNGGRTDTLAFPPGSVFSNVEDLSVSRFRCSTAHGHHGHAEPLGTVFPNVKTLRLRYCVLPRRWIVSELPDTVRNLEVLLCSGGRGDAAPDVAFASEDEEAFKTKTARLETLSIDRYSDATFRVLSPSLENLRHIGMTVRSAILFNIESFPTESVRSLSISFFHRLDERKDNLSRLVAFLKKMTERCPRLESVQLAMVATREDLEFLRVFVFCLSQRCALWAVKLSVDVYLGECLHCRGWTES